jgi:4-diphosphocytidyl-2-C-methyl-D-erythritol kinase
VLNQSFTFPSPAKLNLFLHIVSQRPDGYHNLQTLFQFLDYGDSISITPTNDGKVSLLTHFEGVPIENNLIIKAAKILQKEAEKNNVFHHGAKISINKILPMGGGLGGGSSNAATILLALNTLWQLNFSNATLANLGLSLGADVPIFIHGYAAFAEGVGEKLTPATPDESWYLITKPALSISTVSVFSAPDLTRNTPLIDIKQWDMANSQNDCQSWVIKHHPEVANLMSWLLEYAPSRMTGTGACIFSYCQSQQEACNIQNLLPEGIESFVAKGVNTSPLIKAISNIERQM